MEKFIINHSEPLKGTVRISGAKNAVLPILAATILTRDKCTIGSVPSLRDVKVMIEILHELGFSASFDSDLGIVRTDGANILRYEEKYELAEQMRGSFLIMGPLLARLGRARIPLPGGCQIGSRPVDLHLKGFAAMGATIVQEFGYIDIYGKNLKGANIYLDFPSVGATENILMAATLADGTTVIENAAEEPEISDLAAFINKMGGNISGAGTGRIVITGVKELFGASHTVIPDRIEAGTFMAAVAVAGGNIVLENVIWEHMKPIIAKLEEANVKCVETPTGIRVYKAGVLQAFNLKTLPFPGFPTDMQAQFMSIMALSKGTSIVTETVFENRFLHAGELKRMGANIKIESRSAVVEGVAKLTGTQVRATDLRAGAALILSALAAEGETEISDIYHVERGYYKIEEKLRRLGANIEKKM